MPSSPPPPLIVYVFPLPVWPYAKTVPLKPCTAPETTGEMLLVYSCSRDVTSGDTSESKLNLYVSPRLAVEEDSAKKLIEAEGFKLALGGGADEGARLATEGCCSVASMEACSASSTHGFSPSVCASGAGLTRTHTTTLLAEAGAADSSSSPSSSGRSSSSAFDSSAGDEDSFGSLAEELLSGTGLEGAAALMGDVGVAVFAILAVALPLALPLAMVPDSEEGLGGLLADA